MDDLTVIGNLIEAVLWLGFAGTFTALAIRTTHRKSRLWVILAIAFLAFGASDVIEAQTGAWWRPLWLLVLKATCLAVFFWGVLEYRRLRQCETAQ